MSRNAQFGAGTSAAVVEKFGANLSASLLKSTGQKSAAVGDALASDAERDIIRESFMAEVYPDYLKDPDGKRSPANGVNPTVEIAVLYGCAAYMDYPSRVKTTIKRFLDSNEPQKAYSYEITNVKVLKGDAAPVARPSDRASTFDVYILLNGVLDVNGVPLLAILLGEMRFCGGGPAGT